MDINQRALLIGLFAGAGATWATANEILHYRTSLNLEVASVFDGQAEPDKIIAAYFPDSSDRDQVKSRIKTIVSQRGKTLTVTKPLTISNDGKTDYDLQVLAVVLPDGKPEVRHETARDGLLATWSTFSKEISSYGYVNKPGRDSLIWPTKLRTLFQYLPLGVLASEYPVPANAEALLETPFTSFEASSPGPPPENPRIIVVHYADAARTSVKEIVGYWNVRSKQPAFRAQFDGSRVNGNRHTFRKVVFLNYDNGAVSSIERFDLKKREETPSRAVQQPPQGHSFLDRRLGPGRHYTFAYEGNRFPTEDEVRRIFDTDNAPTRPFDPRPLIQLFVGVLFIAVGALLWARSKRTH